MVQPGRLTCSSSYTSWAFRRSVRLMPSSCVVSKALLLKMPVMHAWVWHSSCQIAASAGSACIACSVTRGDPPFAMPSAYSALQQMDVKIA